MDEEEYSSEDIEEIEEKAFKDLQSGKLVVRNPDGTLRCPYSPSKKKQAYAFKDLLQHAEGVAKGKRGAEAAGKHIALEKYLRTDLASMAVPKAERTHKLDLPPPTRNDQEDLLVYPWSGVIYNINNAERGMNGMKVGPGVAEIKAHLAVFFPEKVHVFWGPRGHMGMGVVTFRRNSEGLRDALAFERWFADRHLTRRDWRRKIRGNDHGPDLYGWLARKEDYDGRSEMKDAFQVAKYLQEIGDLKDVGMVGEEADKMQDQRFRNLAATFSEKDRELQNLVTESEIARRNAEFLRQQLEEKHSQELERVKKAAKQSTEEHTVKMQEYNKTLQASLEVLKNKCKDLEDKEDRMPSTNAADKKLITQEKTQNRLQMAMVNKQTERRQAKEVKLIKMHEEEWRNLEEKIQDAKLRLAEKHRGETEKQRLEEKRDTEKLMEVLAEASQTNDSEDWEKKLKSMEDQNAVMAEELEQVKDDNEYFTDALNVLTQKHTTANDELEAARKVSVKAMRKFPSATIKVKRMGEMDEQPWKAACRQVYSRHEDGWEVAFKTKMSEWEDRLVSHEFNPIKIVDKGNGKCERRVDDSNEELRTLRNDLGNEVHDAVVTALMEIEEYNGSGRYPVPVVWNFEENRRATMAEVMEVLIAALDPKKKRGVKRPAAARA